MDLSTRFFDCNFFIPWSGEVSSWDQSLFSHMERGHRYVWNRKMSTRLWHAHAVSVNEKTASYSFIKRGEFFAGLRSLALCLSVGKINHRCDLRYWLTFNWRWDGEMIISDSIAVKLKPNLFFSPEKVEFRNNEPKFRVLNNTWPKPAFTHKQRFRKYKQRAARKRISIGKTNKRWSHKRCTIARSSTKITRTGRHIMIRSQFLRSSFSTGTLAPESCYTQ